MKRSILLLTLFLPLLLSAQFKISGNVSNETEKITWANVVLLSENDQLVTGGITEESGAFALSVKSGDYRLVVSFLGYENFEKQISVEGDLNLGEIRLKETANALEEVTVSYRKKLIEQKADRIVFTIENSMAATGGDALDALKIAPGLRVDDNGIRMLGKGNSQVMINGRIFPLTGTELIGYLNSISADDIKKIEVITNPPAKYEASGNGGLINIILKKGIQDSWKNTTTMSYNINTHSFLTVRNSLLYYKNSWNISLSLDNTSGSLQALEDFQVYYPENMWNIAITTKDKQDAFSGRLLLDYNLTGKTTIGMQYLGNNRQPDIKDKSISSIFNSAGTLDSLLINSGTSIHHTNSHLINAHSITELDTVGRKLSFDLDYFQYRSDTNRDFKTDSFSPEMDFRNINASAITTSDQSIENFTFKGDMEHPLNFLNLSYGFLVSSTKSQSEIENFNTQTGTPLFDANTSNTFRYMENNQALYLNGTRKLNDRWALQIGLRAENTQTEGYSKNLDQTNSNKYLKVFPTAYLSYNKNETNSISLSYGKRIRRPSYGNLNPFRVYVSSNTYSEGNPFLQPSFTDVFEFKHTYKNKLTTNAFFNRTIDGSGVIFTSEVDTKTQIVTRENFYDQNSYGIGESYLFNTINWLQSQNSFTLVNIQTKLIKPIDALPQNGFSFNLTSNNSISISETTKMQIDASYNSYAKSDLFTIGETFSLDFGLSKTFLNNNLQLAVFVKDIFDTSSLNNLSSTVNGVRQVYGQSRNNRFVRVSASYNFGNKKIKVKERSFGNDEERRRAN